MVIRPRMSFRRRDGLFIVAEMLDIARKGALKTYIMYKANLSFAQLNEYLSLLLDLNLLERVKTSEKAVYKATEKGLRYLQSYREIRDIMKCSHYDIGNVLEIAL